MLAAVCLLLLHTCRARPASSALTSAVGGRRGRQVLQSAAPSPTQLDVATLPPGAQAAALSSLNLTSLSLPTDGGTLVYSADANGAPMCSVLCGRACPPHTDIPPRRHACLVTALSVTFIYITSNYTVDGFVHTTHAIPAAATDQAGTLACAVACSQSPTCSSFNFCARPASANCTLASGAGFRQLPGGACEFIQMQLMVGCAVCPCAVSDLKLHQTNPTR